MEHVLDRETRELLFEKDKQYTLSQFIKIAKKSAEGKKAYKGDYNFGKGIKLAEYLKKNLPSIKFVCTVYRAAWNYGENMVVTIRIKGDAYPYSFSFSSGDSTRQPTYSFSKLFNGTKKPSKGEVETQWGTGVIHGSYQSISKFDEFMADVVGVFNDYERVNGVPFSAKAAQAAHKQRQKINAGWDKIQPRVEKLYYEAKENARKVKIGFNGIRLAYPKLKLGEKEVFYKTDEPRELRHPDEYGERAYAAMDSKEYAKYEKAQSKLSDILQKFCDKHGLEFAWHAG